MDCRKLPVKDSQITNVDWAFLFLTFFSLLATCSCSTRAIGQPDLQKLHDRTYEVVSIGMPIEDAKIQMEKLGFGCELIENGTIKFTDETHPNITTIRNVTFLECIRMGRSGPIAGAITVQLLIKDGRVEKMYDLILHDPVL